MGLMTPLVPLDEVLDDVLHGVGRHLLANPSKTCPVALRGDGLSEATCLCLIHHSTLSDVDDAPNGLIHMDTALCGADDPAIAGQLRLDFHRYPFAT
jgi:hypothetical protein